jgi:hypothetical protein
MFLKEIWIYVLYVNSFFYVQRDHNHIDEDRTLNASNDENGNGRELG